MSKQVTITLSDEVYSFAESMAILTERDVKEVLGWTLEFTLPFFKESIHFDPLETLSDEQVLAMSEAMMPTKYSKRLSKLLQTQQERKLSEKEQYELNLFMYIYNVGTLRKAEALVEAVNRGLRERGPYSLKQ